MKNATESQNTQILTALINGRKITPLDALDWFGCFRLSARISELKSAGWNIEKETVLLSSGKRIARYYMDVEKT
jgi:hypothetical protein